MHHSQAPEATEATILTSSSIFKAHRVWVQHSTARALHSIARSVLTLSAAVIANASASGPSSATQRTHAIDRSTHAPIGDGGCVLTHEGDALQLHRVALLHCHALKGSGGAVAVAGASLDVTTARVVNASAERMGGAVYASASSGTLRGVEVQEAIAHTGGAFALEDSTVLVAGLRISRAIAHCSAGAVLCKRSTVLSESEANAHPFSTMSARANLFSLLQCSSGCKYLSGNASAYTDVCQEEQQRTVYARGGECSADVTRSHSHDCTRRRELDICGVLWSPPLPMPHSERSNCASG